MERPIPMRVVAMGVMEGLSDLEAGDDSGCWGQMGGMGHSLIVIVIVIVEGEVGSLLLGC